VIAWRWVQGLFHGYNGTLFAYGQTGAGKTHTMEGNIDDPQLRGIIPRMVDTVFQEVEEAPEDVEFTVKVGMVEIYQERIRDLLEPSHDSLSIHAKKDGSLCVPCHVGHQAVVVVGGGVPRVCCC